MKLVHLNNETVQFSNDIENIFIQSNVVTINFTKNMGTAVTDFEKLIEDFFLFMEMRKNDSWGHWCLWFYW